MSTLRERIEGLVVRLRDEAKNLIENGRDSQDIAIFNALAIEKLTTAEGLESLLAAALVAEGQDPPKLEWLTNRVKELESQCEAYAKHILEMSAAAPSLHAEGEKAAPVRSIADYEMERLAKEICEEEFGPAALHKEGAGGAFETWLEHSKWWDRLLSADSIKFARDAWAAAAPAGRAEQREEK